MEAGENNNNMDIWGYLEKFSRYLGFFLGYLEFFREFPETYLGHFTRYLCQGLMAHHFPANSVWRQFFIHSQQLVEKRLGLNKVFERD